MSAVKPTKAPPPASKSVPTGGHFRPEPLQPPRVGVSVATYLDYLACYARYVEVLDSLRNDFWSSKEAKSSKSPSGAPPPKARKVPMAAQAHASYGTFDPAAPTELPPGSYVESKSTTSQGRRHLGTVSLDGTFVNVRVAEATIVPGGASVPAQFEQRPVRDYQLAGGQRTPTPAQPDAPAPAPRPVPAPPVAAPSVSGPRPAPKAVVGGLVMEGAVLLGYNQDARRRAARRRQRAARRLRDIAKKAEEIRASTSLVKAQSAAVAAEWTLVTKKAKLAKKLTPPPTKAARKPKSKSAGAKPVAPAPAASIVEVLPSRSPSPEIAPRRAFVPPAGFNPFGQTFAPGEYFGSGAAQIPRPTSPAGSAGSQRSYASALSS